MKIENTLFQSGLVEAHSNTPNTNPMLGAVNHLAGTIIKPASQPASQPNALALTHQFADVRIADLCQHADQLLGRMLNELESSSSNPQAEMPVERKVGIVARAYADICKVNLEINAFVQLKDRNFAPLQDGALVVPLSGHGFGGASKHEIQEMKTQIKIVEAQISALNTLIPKVVKKLEKATTRESSAKYQKRLREYRADLSNKGEELTRRQRELASAQGASGSR